MWSLNFSLPSLSPSLPPSLPPSIPPCLAPSFFPSFLLPSLLFSLSLDPSVVGTGVTMVPNCTDRSQPSVLITVQPSLHSTIKMIDTSNEQFHLGYNCEGSLFLAKNFSQNVSLTPLVFLFYFLHAK